MRTGVVQLREEKILGRPDSLISVSKEGDIRIIESLRFEKTSKIL